MLLPPKRLLHPLKGSLHQNAPSASTKTPSPPTHLLHLRSSNYMALLSFQTLFSNLLRSFRNHSQNCYGSAFKLRKSWPINRCSNQNFAPERCLWSVVHQRSFVLARVPFFKGLVAYSSFYGFTTLSIALLFFPRLPSWWGTLSSKPGAKHQWYCHNSQTWFCSLAGLGVVLGVLGALAGLGVLLGGLVLGVGFGRAGRAGWVGRGFKVQKYTLEIQK